MNNYFSSNLFHLRKELDYSQQTVADALGKRPSSIGNWESGRQEPAVSDLVTLADFFKLDLDDIVKKDLSSLNSIQILEIQNMNTNKRSYEEKLESVKSKIEVIQAILST